MPSPVAPHVTRTVRLLMGVLLVLTLNACASFGSRDPLGMHVVGIEPLPGEGLEMRFAVKLRVQNPNSRSVAYQGIALELRVNDRLLARGVSDQRVSIARFGETLLVVPVSVSVFSAVRQALGLAESVRLESVPYVLRGKLGGGLWGSRRFADAGSVDLSALVGAGK